MVEGRRPAIGHWVAGTLILLTPLALAACAALSGGNSASARPQSGIAANVPQAASIEELRKRPLRPPSASTSCPTLPTHEDLQPVLSTGLAPGKPPVGPNYGYGDGPVYLSGQTDFYPGGFDLAIWLVKPPYSGPLLIRGQQVNGPARTAFSQQSDEYGKSIGLIPGPSASTVSAYGMSLPFYGELDLPAGAQPPYWGAYFADTHFDVAGCYFIQVDGTTFSEFILLEVPDAARPPA
jgi:hypothetical protein